MYQSKVTYRLKTGDPEVVRIETEKAPIDDLSLPDIKREVYFNLTTRPSKIDDIIIINVDEVTVSADTKKPVNPFIETINGCSIRRVAIRNDMEIYTVDNFRSIKVPKYVVFNNLGVEVSRCHSIKELNKFFDSIGSTEKPDLAIPITKIVSITNKIIELSNHKLNANEIAADSSLAYITRAELIRVILYHQRVPKE
jgi:hypothetical protein